MRRNLQRLFAAGLAAFTLAGSVSTALAATPTYDPYADSVYASSSSGVNNPNNAVGAPDGQTTNQVGINKFITLDMGLGEEGTGTLRVYFGSIVLKSEMTVEFLDKDTHVIKSESAQLSASTSTHTEDFPYEFAQFGKAYRYVRLTNTVEAGFTLDAVEAMAYIGKTATVDTDGDGIPDRTEQQNGTDPQDPNSPPAPTPSPTCTQDTWTCTDFSACSSSGSETRTCRMTADCPNVAVEVLGVVRELKMRAAVCAEHAALLANRRNKDSDR